MKARLARFSDAQANKTTSKDFFPAIFREWRSEWPTPDPTPEETMQAGKPPARKGLTKMLYVDLHDDFSF